MSTNFKKSIYYKLILCLVKYLTHDGMIETNVWESNKNNEYHVYYIFFWKVIDF
jgi:hypothetical protein